MYHSFSQIATLILHFFVLQAIFLCSTSYISLSYKLSEPYFWVILSFFLLFDPIIPSFPSISAEKRRFFTCLPLKFSQKASKTNIREKKLLFFGYKHLKSTFLRKFASKNLQTCNGLDTSVIKFGSNPVKKDLLRKSNPKKQPRTVFLLPQLIKSYSPRAKPSPPHGHKHAAVPPTDPWFPPHLPLPEVLQNEDSRWYTMLHASAFPASQGTLL